MRLGLPVRLTALLLIPAMLQEPVQAFRPARMAGRHCERSEAICNDRLLRRSPWRPPRNDTLFTSQALAGTLLSARRLDFLKNRPFKFALGSLLLAAGFYQAAKGEASWLLAALFSPMGLSGRTRHSKIKPQDDPDAYLILLEALIDKSTDHVSPPIRWLIRRQLEQGRLVAVLSEAPYEEKTDGDPDRDIAPSWRGLRPQFLNDFLEDLMREVPGPCPWLDNLRIYTDDGSREFAVVEKAPGAPTAWSRFGVARTDYEIHFPNPIEFRNLVEQYLKEKGRLGHPVPFAYYQMDIPGPAWSDAERFNLQDWLRRQLPSDALISVRNRPEGGVRITASDFSTALERFGSFARTQRGQEPIRRVVALDKNRLSGFDRMGVPPKAGQFDIILYDGERQRSEAPEPGVQLRDSPQEDYRKTAHRILQAVLAQEAHPESSAGVRSEIIARLQQEYPNSWPKAIVLDLNHGLTRGYDPVDPVILDDILKLLEKGARVAVLAENPVTLPGFWTRLRLSLARVRETWSAPLQGELRPAWMAAAVRQVLKNTLYTERAQQVQVRTVASHFLDPLVAQARRTGRVAALSGLTCYAESGATILMFSPELGRFSVQGRFPLDQPHTVRKEVQRVLAAQGLGIIDLIQTPFQLIFRIRDSQINPAPVTAGALRQTLLSDLPELRLLHVMVRGAHRLAINTHSQRMAIQHFLEKAGAEERPLLLSSYLGFSPKTTAAVGGLWLSLREAAPPEHSTADFVPLKLDMSRDAIRILSRSLPDGSEAATSGVATPPRLKEFESPLAINLPGNDQSLPGTYGAFHSRPGGLQWLVKNPPEVLYLISAGGAGDIKSTILLARLLRQIFANQGPGFKRPKMILVDSTVKRSEENPFGGPPDIHRLFAPGLPNLKPYSIKKVRARHFYELPDGLSCRYNLPNENGLADAHRYVDTEWSIGQAASVIRKDNFIGPADTSQGAPDLDEIILMDSNQPPRELAEDLLRLYDRRRIAVMGVDVGGDSLATLSEPIRRPFMHDEEGICSATTDTHSLTLFHELRSSGVGRVALAVAGLGQDGEMEVSLYRRLEHLVKSGGLQGVLDTIRFCQQAPEGRKSLEFARDLPIWTESSQQFILGILDAVLSGRPSDFDALRSKGSYSLWRYLTAPDRTHLPTRPLRLGTRIEDRPRLAPSYVFLDPSAIVQEWSVPADHLRDFTWWEIDHILQQKMGLITETNEKDRIAQSIQQVTLPVLVNVLKNIPTGKFRGRLTWRFVSPLTRDKEEYRRAGQPALFRIAWAQAAGPMRWPEQESILWDIIRTLKNPYVIAAALSALEAIGQAGEKQLSLHPLEEIRAMISDPTRAKQWTPDPLAHGLDESRVRDGARRAVAVFQSSIQEKGSPTSGGLKTLILSLVMVGLSAIHSFGFHHALMKTDLPIIRGAA